MSRSPRRVIQLRLSSNVILNGRLTRFRLICATAVLVVAERLGYQAIADRLNADLALNPPPVPVDPERAVGRWTDTSTKSSRLIRTLEITDDLDPDFIRDINQRRAELHVLRDDLEGQLAARQQGEDIHDPTLLDPDAAQHPAPGHRAGRDAIADRARGCRLSLSTA